MNIVFKVPLVALIGFGLSGCLDSGSDSGSGTDPDMGSVERFAAAASPSQEVGFDPTVDGNAPPNCYAFFEYDGADSLDFDIFCHRIDDVTAAHIHTGSAKQEGSVTALLFSDGDGVTLSNDRLVQGQIQRDDEGLEVSFDDLLDDLRNDRAYFNAHTSVNAAGEVRGQVVPTSRSASELFASAMPGEQVFVSAASPSQEVDFEPEVNGRTPSCTATFVHDGADALDFAIHCVDIDDVTAAHIHNGSAKDEGAVDATLFDDTAGVSIEDGMLVEGTLNRGDAELAVDFDELLERMQQDGAYFNVHTEANAAGEVRGQIIPTQPAGTVAELFVTAASPSQEFGFDPVVDESMPPACAALFRYNGADHIDHEIFCSRISGVTAAHIHQGSANETGGVDATLFEDMDSQDVDAGELTAGRVSRDDVGSDEFDAMLDRMRNDEAYFNAHTQTNADGEVRGQIAPVFMPIATLMGMTEDDEHTYLSVATPSQEVGFEPDVAMPMPVCVTNMRFDGADALHYTIDCANISNVVEAHIHTGDAKEEGGVLAFLFEYGDENGNGDGVDVRNGRLVEDTLNRDDLDEGVFDDIIELANTDGAYVNVHTTANALGEVRGQLVNLTLSSGSTLGIGSTIGQ